MVLSRGVARAGQLEGDHATRVGDDADSAAPRSGNCGCAGGASTWAWPNWARVQLILVNKQEPAEGAILVQAGVAHGVLGRGHPGGPLGLLERPPAGGHVAEVVAHGHLRRRARIGNMASRPADLAELAILRDVQATFT